jgi:hypothetical protein
VGTHFSTKTIQCFIASEGEDLKDHKRIWEAAKDSYLLDLISTSVNVPDANFASLSDEQFNDRLDKVDDRKKWKKLPIVDPFQIPKQHSINTRIIHYPISLANCGTIDGNITVLNEYCSSLGLDSNLSSTASPLVYNARRANFDLNESRLRKQFIARITSILEKEQNNVDSTVVENSFDKNDNKEDDVFNVKYNEIHPKLFNSRDVCKLVTELRINGNLSALHDKFGRSLLHAATEFEHFEMVQLLFDVGFNPNVVEHIGITSLCIAVIKGNISMARLLLENGADCKISVPSAYSIAQDIGQNDIISLFDSHLHQQFLCDSILKQQCSVNTSETVVEETPIIEDSHFHFNRTNVKVPVFGDNGVEKQIRSIKTKSGKYGVFCECPGDLHASGYACECMAKTMGKAGMYYCLDKVLKRTSNEATFGTLKFQEGNLSLNAEACRDVAFGYGLALFQCFKESTYYPSKEEVDDSPTGDLLLWRFKLFIKDIESNERCKYYLQAVTLFGPWLNMYKRSVRNRYGLGREVTWLIGLLIFGPLQKKNYSSSAFVHCVNFCYAWSRLTRDLVRNHFSIAVKGRVGHNIAMDEYVETYLVKPLKMYATGHTSIKVLKMLSSSSQLFKQVRDSYVQGFSGPLSRHHKIADPLSDQLKVCTFAIQQGFFDKSSVQSIKVFGPDGPTDHSIGKNVQEIENKGRTLMKKMFPSKMYTYYAEWRNKPETR